MFLIKTTVQFALAIIPVFSFNQLFFIFLFQKNCWPFLYNMFPFTKMMSSWFPKWRNRCSKMFKVSFYVFLSFL